ncbi:MAG: hypothetical protein ACO2OZ_02100 [Acidilobaceae archaeon]|jgi:hypothetical protein
MRQYEHGDASLYEYGKPFISHEYEIIICARALRVLLEGLRKTVRGSRLLKILADAIRSRGLEVVECSLDKRAQLEVRL